MPSTNGAAESHVKIAKRILQKTEDYSQFQQGLARYRNCPRPDSHNQSPSTILFGRDLREPDLVALPPKLDLSMENAKVLLGKLAVSKKKVREKKNSTN